MRALKLIFFADRYHLRKYGRPVTNDQYWAMKLGPVPSGVKDLFELDSASSDERHYAERFFVRGQVAHRIRSIAPVDTNVLSSTDMEALRFAWSTFGPKPSIVERAHEYPEWKRHEAALHGGQTRVAMDYLDFLDDPGPNIPVCHPLTHEECEERRAQLQEVSEIAALWR